VVVSRGDTSRISKLRNEFDIVIADVPCSGEGMFRKDEEAVAQWTPGLVAECARLQREIIDNLWPALRPGGYLIYSTCTFNRSENQDNVRYMIDELGAEHVEIPVDPAWGIVERDGCLHFLPGKIRGEGLTVSVVRKPGSYNTKGQRTEKLKAAPAQAKPCVGWIDNGERCGWQIVDDRIVAMADPHRVARIGKALDLIYTGVEVANVKGRDVIPTQALAMSRNLSEAAFPRYEVSYEEAINYLRRDTVTLEGAPRGHVLLTFNDKPLGFVKNLGNRANNLYPAPWRILSSLK
jgi:NOL1/NOP2/fmu family ribosome biogenesis protein